MTTTDHLETLACAMRKFVGDAVQSVECDDEGIIIRFNGERRMVKVWATTGAKRGDSYLEGYCEYGTYPPRIEPVFNHFPYGEELESWKRSKVD